MRTSPVKSNAKRINKDILRAEANCIEVAKYIGIEVVTRGINNFMLCPGHTNRLGRPDTALGNCVVYEDGYVCFACNPNKKHDVFTMVMEHTNCSFAEALNIVAEIYGGADIYKTTYVKEEKLALSTDDLKMLGIKPNIKLFSPINGSYRHFEPEEGSYIEKTNNEYLVSETPSSYSLIAFKRDNETAFNHLIMEKAKCAYMKYTKALSDYSTRTSPKAGVVFDLFNEDGAVDDSVFFGIQNALKKKIFRCEEIYREFKEKEKQ
jgi:hypothetical protein